MNIIYFRSEHMNKFKVVKVEGALRTIRDQRNAFIDHMTNKMLSDFDSMQDIIIEAVSFFDHAIYDIEQDTEHFLHTHYGTPEENREQLIEAWRKVNGFDHILQEGEHNIYKAILKEKE
jgi:hypothetical protein